jgi:hypothetical protein
MKEVTMAGSSPWVIYTGTSEIVLIVVLLAAAAAVAYAAVRLPLPARPPRPGPAAAIIMITAWAAALAALAVCAGAYETRTAAAGFARPSRSNPITPVTLIGALVVFAVIAYAQKSRGWRTALGSAVLGAAAGPWLFEIAFDLVILPRTHPVINPGLWLPLLFGPLILTGLTTVTLITLSPALRIQRATLCCLAAMLTIFAAWALYGFAYPSGPGPVTLNAASKILALLAALTLFLPQRTPATTPEPAQPPAANGARAGIG